MARFALIKPDNTIDRMATNVDPTVQTKAGWKWLDCPIVAQPSYDSAAETIDGPAYVVGASSVTETWTKRSLTAQEISDRKDSRVSAIDSLQFVVMLDMENRVRVLEGKATVTAAQYRAALKARL